MDQQQPMSLFDGAHDALKQNERAVLERLEASIEEGLRNFKAARLRIGAALREIHENQLYKAYGTFKAYCEKRWQVSQVDAHRLMGSAEVLEDLYPMGEVLPANERQTRPLLPLSTEQRREVWPQVIDSAPNGKITSGHVQRVVDAYRQEINPSASITDDGAYDESVDNPEPINIEDSHGHVETVWAQPAKMAVHFSSDTPEHYTPTGILDAVVACLGAIDLDPCSNDHDAPNVPAGKHYTAADDGLAQFWHGKVFMNPPYGREIARWVDKLVTEYEAERVTEAIALVPARTDTDWWERLVDGYKFTCFVHGRLTFIGNEEVAPFPSALVYLGSEPDRFYYAFRSFGRIVQELHPEMFGA